MPNTDNTKKFISLRRLEDFKTLLDDEIDSKLEKVDSKFNVQFTQSDQLENITSGENISTSFGKLSKWYGEINKKIETEATYADVEALFNNFKFQGTSSFTLGTMNGGKWDGTVEYSTDLSTWETWDGTTTLSSGEGNVLYLRGKNNTRFATSLTNFTKFVFTTTGTITCNGDIRRLLDYENPENTTMANYCYYRMFNDCTSLTKAPELPATTLASYCYRQIFWGCTSLIEAPELPATTLASSCYYGMFTGCTSLTKAPELPAITLTSYCYYCMFQGCTSLTKAPELPATTLAGSCYSNMFKACTSLTTLIALPVTKLVEHCYEGMFQGCTNIKVSTTQVDEYQTSYRIPTTGTGTTATGAMLYMFTETGGTFTGTPTINTTYYTSNTVVSAS